LRCIACAAKFEQAVGKADARLQVRTLDLQDPSIQRLGFGITRNSPEDLGAGIEQLRMVWSNCKPTLRAVQRLLHQPAVQLCLRKSGDSHGLVWPYAVGQQQEL
jgi:hypothetical protein